jgi:uncharacterized protein
MKAMSRTISLAALVCLSSASAAADPAVDCKTAKLRSIERLMCGAPMLQRLDQELARLYALATAPKAVTAGPAIRKQQTTWIAQRADCAKSKTQAQCVRDVYLARIAAIRAQSRPARSADDKGISLGPFAFQCEDVQAPLDITFVNTDPGLAWTTIKDRSYPLVQQRSGSGARYEGDGTLFWEHQGEARWRGTTNSPEVTCKRTTS